MSKARITSEIKAYVMSTFNCCVACGTWDADECGHIIAESKGGAMVKENFVRLCGSCNRMQGTATVKFKAYATYTESPATIRTNRAYWAKYVKAAAAGIAKPWCPVA